jgi:hypothetical protein
LKSSKAIRIDFNKEERKVTVMKIRDGYMLSEVAGTPVVVPLGTQGSFHNMIKLNATGKFLWERLQNDTTRAALADAMIEEYGIDRALAEKDLDAFLGTLASFGALEE